ncbi:xyloglucan endotransglucosylase/hydrolase protein 2-like [Rosa rugosa]|uniref:xyloglucan endotransglucosylase/hydrolase protein 2-like n=1 Tax=Rosa rugosa TaxID=74645 RepID=UPI002B4075A1|nr:xyloglucan endotransglucosylase/hydrolase protein 2-like [Rosa rugosa]
MAFSVEGFVVFFLFCGVMLANGDVGFDENYHVIWGFDHALYQDGGTGMQIYLDQYTGAGFQSKQWFGSGWFHMRIKVPVRDCAGVVLAFYLRSEGDRNQDELDFEFLGNREGKPITLQTNVITNGDNFREQRTLLWFDPTADFHDYKILWNHHQVVFYIDDIPIRVFRNNKKIKVPYLTRPMVIDASIWDGSDWATDGGQTKIDYNHAPFRAYFQGFDMNACSLDKSKTNVSECYATKYLWNHRVYWQLNPTEQEAYDRVRREYMNYDYCTDTQRFHTLPRECTSDS